MEQIGVIYALRFSSGHYYIGQTAHLATRIRKHINDANAGRHANIKFQRCFDKYGEPVLEIMDSCNVGFLDHLEEFYIKHNFGFNNCCNLSPSAKTTRGMKFSETGRKNASLSKKGKKWTNRQRESYMALPKKKKNSKSRRLINVDTGQIYESITLAAEAEGFTAGALGNRLKRRRSYPIIFLDEYIKGCHIDKPHRDAVIPVLNVETKEVFPTIKSAAASYGLTPQKLYNRLYNNSSYPFIYYTEDATKMQSRIDSLRNIRKQNIQVIHIYTEKVFHKIKDAAKYAGVKEAALRKRLHQSKDPHYMLHSEWLSLTYEERADRLINPPIKPTSGTPINVIHKETGVVFESINKAADAFSIKGDTLSQQLRKRYTCCPFMYYSDWLEQNKAS